jgi:hypothetical protein
VDVGRSEAPRARAAAYRLGRAPRVTE